MQFHVKPSHDEFLSDLLIKYYFTDIWSLIFTHIYHTSYEAYKP